MSVPSLPRRGLLALTAAVPASSVLGAAPAQDAHAQTAHTRAEHGRTGLGGRRAPRRRLAEPAHLDFLCDTVTPPPLPGHDTYRLREEPALGTLWTYAERQQDGSYRRTGGGELDPETGHYEQGAFNADDVARAAVAYLRHWSSTGSARSRRSARQLLRGVCYLQTTEGPHAGNVVLWQQADGALNRSARPPEKPDPSDSGPSYWLARLLWALGEGFEGFRRADPGFASFIRDRLELALSALERDVLSRYGQWETADGRRVPGWLITHGADASSEAVLGLAAYVRAGGGARARRALARLADGIAALGSGGPGRWPYGAVLPSAASRSQWHAWGAQMPTALTAAADVLSRPGLLRAALADAAGFTPELLTAGGCDNGWLPAPVDRSQIAYGVDARLQALLAVAGRGGAAGLYPLAALTASWYFGANAAGEAVYDPDTGVTFDGISPDGKVNRNSGAESTIHGLLSMLALDSLTDGGPSAAARPLGLAGPAGMGMEREGLRVLEAEDGELTGAAKAVRPGSASTGESEYSHGAYAALRAGGAVSWTLPDDSHGPLLASPVVNLVADREAGTTVWRAEGEAGSASRIEGASGTGEATGIGGASAAGSASRTGHAARTERTSRIDHGTGGAQGITAAPGALTPVALPGTFAPGGRLRALAESAGKHPLRVDAVLVRPAVARLVLSGAEGSLALLHNGDGQPHTAWVTPPGQGPVTVELYDVRARPCGSRTVPGSGARAATRVSVPGHGFAVVRRSGAGRA